MIYAKIENGVAVKYPVYEGELQELYPELSYPLDISGDPIPEGYVKVKYNPPKLDSKLYKATLDLPIFENNEWVESYIVEKLPAEEIKAVEEIIAQDVRRERDNLLRLSDNKVVADLWEKYTPQEKLEWTEYRQALRDLPEQEEFPLNPEFPLEPTVFAVKIM